mmetsp:Transcript_102687/g.219617  ORF Transcript_102687/g.219617 Transcript_102687/m.219617 type:complete len:239 (+) Transcript_102687:393-1109(+)
MVGRASSHCCNDLFGEQQVEQWKKLLICCPFLGHVFCESLFPSLRAASSAHRTCESGPGLAAHVNLGPRACHAAKIPQRLSLAAALYLLEEGVCAAERGGNGLDAIRSIVQAGTCRFLDDGLGVQEAGFPLRTSGYRQGWQPREGARAKRERDLRGSLSWLGGEGYLPRGTPVSWQLRLHSGRGRQQRSAEHSRGDAQWCGFEGATQEEEVALEEASPVGRSYAGAPTEGVCGDLHRP